MLVVLSLILLLGVANLLQHYEDLMPVIKEKVTKIIKVTMPSERANTTSVNGKHIRVGDQIFLGEYDGKRVKWKVLSTIGNRALLLSEKVLTAMPVQTIDGVYTWQRTNVRTWLNDTFMNACFSKPERESILQTDIYTVYQAENIHTADQIFLLKYGEAAYYVDSLEVDWSSAAKTEGDHANCWIVRDGAEDGTGFRVIHNGELEGKPMGSSVEHGVRPAMWVDMTLIP